MKKVTNPHLLRALLMFGRGRGQVPTLPGRPNPWRDKWHDRKRRGAPCSKIERRFFRAHPDKLFAAEKAARGRAKG